MLLFDDHATNKDEVMYINSIDQTLLRYFNDNMSIDSFHLHLDIEKLSLPSHLQKWLQALASRTRLKELSLTICGKIVRTKWLTIPDEIFSSENLEAIILRAANIGFYQVKMNIYPVIKCVFLRVLELLYVNISEGSLHYIFSSCSLLEKINIRSYGHLKEIKVKNMPCLRQLRIADNRNEILEIYGVPSLRVLDHHAMSQDAFKMDPLGSVRELVLFRVLMDNTFSDMVLSKFPFLESLTLKLINCRLETLDITCVSLKRLTLNMFDNRQFNLQVNSPKLLYFCYNGLKVPSLLFPAKTPEHIKLLLEFKKSNPTHRSSFFLKMRKALNLASNFDIQVTTKGLVPLEIDLEDLRRRVPFPARNVEQLSFNLSLDDHLFKLSPLFDLLFSVCYPHQVNAYYKNGNNYLHKLTVIGMMETNTPDLNDIQIKNPRNGKWENMTDSWRRFHFQFELPWRSFHDEANAHSSDEFKLNW